MEIFIIIICSYLCGSIPFGLLITRLFIKKDIRKIGSGNIGATNVLRTGKKTLAATTLVMDVAKGYLPVILCHDFYPALVQVSALFVFLGHLFPIWLKFKGGKGVATYLGILFAFSYGLSFLFIFTWVVVALIFKYSSVSSMFSALTVFIITTIKDIALQSIDPKFTTEFDIKLILFIFVILIFYTHRKNIYNLKNKKEEKIKL